jgi:hypothetical protein
MSEIVSHYNVPNLTVEARNGATSANRRFGKAGATPLAFPKHFHGNLDSWYSAPVDEIAAGHKVIEKTTKPRTTGRTNFICPTPRSLEPRMISDARPIHIAVRCHGCDMPNGKSSMTCEFCHGPLQVTR